MQFDAAGGALFHLPTADGDQEHTACTYEVASGDSLVILMDGQERAWHLYFERNEIQMVQNWQEYKTLTAVNRTIPEHFYTTTYSLRREPSLDPTNPGDVIANFYYHFQKGNIDVMRALIAPRDRHFLTEEGLKASPKRDLRRMTIRILHEARDKACAIILEEEEKYGGDLEFVDGRWWFVR